MFLSLRTDYDFFLILFLCEFLEATNSVPCELALNTIRVVMSFIMSCRLLGLEPQLNVLCHYFVFTLGFDRVLAKHRNNFIKVITDSRTINGVVKVLWLNLPGDGVSSSQGYL